MRPAGARALLAKGEVGALGPSTWADLGCGDGAFTIALASLLASGSTIHAIDHDASALRKIPSSHHGTRITTHRGDFTSAVWPFDDLDGILMANSLHYVVDQLAFIKRCAPHLKQQHRFLIVEYDSMTANAWVPYPVSQTRLADLFRRAGYPSIAVLGTRPSVYRRSPLYAASIESPD